MNASLRQTRAHPRATDSSLLGRVIVTCASPRAPYACGSREVAAYEAPQNGETESVVQRVMRLMIEVPPVIPRSPAHSLASKDVVSIILRGRKSGNVYTATALHDENVVTVTTNGRWWQSVRGGASVTRR